MARRTKNSSDIKWHKAPWSKWHWNDTLQSYTYNKSPKQRNTVFFMFQCVFNISNVSNPVFLCILLHFEEPLLLRPFWFIFILHRSSWRRTIFVHVTINSNRLFGRMLKRQTLLSTWLIPNLLLVSMAMAISTVHILTDSLPLAPPLLLVEPTRVQCLEPKSSMPNVWRYPVSTTIDIVRNSTWNISDNDMSCYVMLCKKRPLSFIMFPRAPLKSWNLVTFKSSKPCFDSQIVGVKREKYLVQLAMACAYVDGFCMVLCQATSTLFASCKAIDNAWGSWRNVLKCLNNNDREAIHFTLASSWWSNCSIGFIESSHQKALRAPQLHQTCQRAQCWNSSRQPPSATLLLPGPIPKLTPGLADWLFIRDSWCSHKDRIYVLEWMTTCPLPGVIVLRWAHQQLGSLHLSKKTVDNVLGKLQFPRPCLSA